MFRPVDRSYGVLLEYPKWCDQRHQKGEKMVSKMLSSIESKLEAAAHKSSVVRELCPEIGAEDFEQLQRVEQLCDLAFGMVWNIRYHAERESR